MFRMLRILYDLFLRPKDVWPESKKDSGIMPAVYFFLAISVLTFAIPFVISQVTGASLVNLDAASQKQITQIAESLSVPVSTVLSYAYVAGFLMFIFLNALLVGAAVVVISWFGGSGSRADTVRVMLYGSAPTLLFGSIPVVGILAFLYSVGIRAYGLHVLHKLDYGKVIGVVFATVLLFFVVALGLFFFGLSTFIGL